MESSNAEMRRVDKVPLLKQKVQWKSSSDVRELIPVVRGLIKECEQMLRNEKRKKEKNTVNNRKKKAKKKDKKIYHTKIPPYQGFPRSEPQMIFEDLGPSFAEPQKYFMVFAWYGDISHVILGIINN
jgi:hypothetical protein